DRWRTEKSADHAFLLLSFGHVTVYISWVPTQALQSPRGSISRSEGQKSKTFWEPPSCRCVLSIYVPVFTKGRRRQELAGVFFTVPPRFGSDESGGQEFESLRARQIASILGHPINVLRTVSNQLPSREITSPRTNWERAQAATARLRHTQRSRTNQATNR